MSFHPQIQNPQPKLQIGSGATPFKTAGFLPNQLPGGLANPGGGAGTIGGSPQQTGAAQFGPLPSYGLDPNVAQAMSGLNRPPPGNAGFNFAGGGGRQIPLMGGANSSGAGQSGIQQVGNVLTGVSASGQQANPFTNAELFTADQLQGLNSGELMFGGRVGPQSLKGKLDAQIGRAQPNDPTAGLDPGALSQFSEAFNSPSGIGSPGSTGSVQGLDPQQLTEILQVLQSLMQQGAV